MSEKVKALKDAFHDFDSVSSNCSVEITDVNSHFRLERVNGMDEAKLYIPVQRNLSNGANQKRRTYILYT